MSLKAKLKTLKRLEAARERIRDVAAAQSAVASQQLAAAQANTARIDRALDEQLDKLPLGQSRANDWLGFADAVERHRLVQKDARQQQAVAHDKARKAQLELQARERAVRSVERQIDSARGQLQAKRDQAEQALADDLSSSRGT